MRNIQNNQSFLGKLAEQAASDYLQKHGLKLLAKNYRCVAGEIDLVMEEGEMLVFVEVRYRHNDEFGSSLESVTRGKQRKVIRAAQYYLQEKNLCDKVTCRFDIVSSNPYSKDDEILWIRDAFWVKW